MKIVYFHNPIMKDYMIETADLIIDLIDLHFDVYNAVTPPKEHPTMYDHLVKLWGKETIIIMGQDNVPTISMIRDLILCHHDLCVNPCISYPPSTALDRPMLNQIDKKGRMYEENERPGWIFYGGTGVSKISMKLQQDIPIKGHEFEFPGMDSTLHKIFHDKYPDLMWHAHYPIHKHTKTEMKDRHWK